MFARSSLRYAAFALGLLAAPALGQIPQAVLTDEEADAVMEGEAEPQGQEDTSEGRTAGERLYRTLRDGEIGEQVDERLSGAMTELDADCPAIERYQVFNRSSSFISMKVKCLDRPVYILTVGPVGLGVLSGGDGSIDRIRSGEGEVRILQGAAPPPERTQQDDLRGEFLLRAAAILLGVLILIGLFIIWLWICRQKRVAAWRGLRTEEKDQMLEEAEEVDPHLFYHPDGVWIARGKRGKRRLFQNRHFARAYRDYGIKIMQIR